MSLYSLSSPKPVRAAGSGMVVLAEGTGLEDVHATGVAERIPHGCPFDIVITTAFWAPVAPLFDLAGSEWVADRLYNESGAIVEDVESTGAHTVVMHCRANAVQLIALIGAIGAVLFGVAAVITSIRVEAPEDLLGSAFETARWLVAGGLGIGILLLARELVRR